VTPTSQKRDVELPLADVNLASSFPIHSTTEVEWMVHPECWKTPCNPALAELGRGTQIHAVRLETKFLPFDQKRMEGSQAPAGSLYRPVVISMRGSTTRRPLERHQRKSSVLRVGMRMPGPP
jgi:hypothetical protein